MNLKKLTQAVFDGLRPEYRWAAVDANSKAWAFIKKPVCDDLMFCDGDDAKSENVGVFFDPTDWQDSLIERLDVPTAADIDWSAAPERATHFQPECEATNSGGRYFKDGFKSVFEPEMHAAWLAVSKSIDLTGVIEIPTKPEPKVDWSKAPAGATHWHDGEWIRWTGHKDMNLWNLDAWDDGCRWTLSAYGFHGTLEDFLADGAIPRPPVHDVARRDPVLEMARSIEVARVAEQSERTYPHYFKDVSDVDAIDLYHVARLYDITDPALFHAFKKIACAGKRGAKDQAQDVQEAIDALKRWQELSA